MKRYNRFVRRLKRALLLSTLTAIIFNVHPCQCVAQPPEDVLLYLSGVRSKGALVMNVRGVEVTIDHAAGVLTSSEAAGHGSASFYHKLFPNFGLHAGYNAAADSTIGIRAFHIEKTRKVHGIERYNEYYFLQSGSDSVIGMRIESAHKPNPEIIAALAWLAMRNAFPDSLFTDVLAPELLFAGRKIVLGKVCGWTGPNTMLCSGLGEINWSMHPTLSEAKEEMSLQIAANMALTKVKPMKEEVVTVIFEGKEVRAERREFKVKGLSGLMAGSRTLIVYYVVAEARNRFVRCVLSHWTTDYLTESGLPPLLSEVMKLK